MKTIIQPEDYESVLALWRGARARIWIFHISRKRMAIKLSKQDLHEALYVIAIACERFAGPFRWDQANITIVTEPPNQWGEVRHRVVDADAGFELVCTDVVIVRGPEGPPADPFDSFFDEKQSNPL
jgi:hypothetical protein